jgi:hypothetical protein
MSMGGGSDGVTPIRRSSYRPIDTSESATPEPAAPSPRPAAEEADPALPTYVAVGGGLSNRRIVTKLPTDFGGESPYESTLQKVVKYVISPEVATSPADAAVVDAVKERIELPDFRLLINNTPGLGEAYNLAGREAFPQKLEEYLVKKSQRTASGTVDVNFCDIAVVTHDEGGNKPYMTIDRLLER